MVVRFETPGGAVEGGEGSGIGGRGDWCGHKELECVWGGISRSEERLYGGSRPQGDYVIFWVWVCV